MTDRPTLVEAWNAMASWSKERAHREAEVFTRRQPAVTALAMAYLEDEGANAQGLGMQLALALDAVYAGRLGCPPWHSAACSTAGRRRRRRCWPMCSTPS